MITFNILTLFPEAFPGILQHGLLGKALLKNHFKINTINIRDYSDLSANSVDDKPFLLVANRHSSRFFLFETRIL